MQTEREILDTLEPMFPLKFRKLTANLADDTWIALDRYRGNKITAMRQLNQSLESLSIEKQTDIFRVYHTLNEFD